MTNPGNTTTATYFRKIIVEEFFSEDGHTVPKDYKFFCFRGAPQIIQVDTDRFSNQFQNFHDTGWNRIPVVALYQGKEQDDDNPVLLDRMLDLAGNCPRRSHSKRWILRHGDGHTEAVN